MTDRHVVVFIAPDPHQAHLMRNLLTDAGISSFVSNETLNSVHFAGGDWLIRAAGMPGFLPTSPKLVVHQDDADEAREILLAAEKLIQHGQPAPELVALESETGEELWPLCPHCARPRLATCPVCKSSGTDFIAAFLPEEQTAAAEEPTRMVICPTCDEVFTPWHPARCEWCGHRFADGYELPARPTTTTSMQNILAEQVNSKSLLLLAAIACGGIALVAWFAYVLR